MATRIPHSGNVHLILLKRFHGPTMGSKALTSWLSQAIHQRRSRSGDIVLNRLPTEDFSTKTRPLPEVSDIEK